MFTVPCRAVPCHAVPCRKGSVYCRRPYPFLDSTIPRCLVENGKHRTHGVGRWFPVYGVWSFLSWRRRTKGGSSDSINSRRSASFCSREMLGALK